MSTGPCSARHTRHRQPTPHHAHTALCCPAPCFAVSRANYTQQATDDAEPKPGLKYWTGFTVMYSTRQDEKSIKARAQKRAKEREMRAKIKWRELGGLFAYLRMPSRAYVCVGSAVSGPGTNTVLPCLCTARLRSTSRRRRASCSVQQLAQGLCGVGDRGCVSRMHIAWSPCQNRASTLTHTRVV